MNTRYSPLDTEENIACVRTPLEEQMDTHTDEDGVSTVPNATISCDPPPCYSVTYTGQMQESTPSRCVNPRGLDALPTYESAMKLPTYQDVEKQKEDEARMNMIDALFGTTANDSEDDEPRLDGILVGSDCMFFFAFFIGFIFNWVGLFIGYFFMFNLAGRYGAITGFGISLIKSLIYLRYSDCCQDLSIKNNVYIYMLMNLVALLIVVKGVHSWLKVRPYMYNHNS